MSELIEGDFVGKCTRAEYGANSKGVTEARLEMQVVGGPHDGKKFWHKGKLAGESTKWTKMRMAAVGWKGVSIRTLTDDVAAAKLTVPFTLKIADNNGSRWTAVDRIGDNSQPLKQLSNADIDMLDNELAAADAVDADPESPF